MFDVLRYEFGEINFYDLEYHSLIEHDFVLSDITTVLRFRRNGITYELIVTPSELDDKTYEIQFCCVKIDGTTTFELTNFFQQFHIFKILIGMFEHLLDENDNVHFSFVSDEKMNRILKYIYNKQFSFLKYNETKENEMFKILITK